MNEVGRGGEGRMAPGEERLAEGTKGDFRIHVEGLEPGLKEVTQALEEQLARGY